MLSFDCEVCYHDMTFASVWTDIKLSNDSDTVHSSVTAVAPPQQVVFARGEHREHSSQEYVAGLGAGLGCRRQVRRTRS